MQADKNHIIVFIIIVTVIILLLISLIVTLLYLYQKKQLIYQRNLINLQSDYEKSLLKTQIEIQEDTFQYISREIHDNISLSLTLAKLNLNIIDWNSTTDPRKQVTSSLEQISKAIDDLSDLSKGLNSEMIISQGLIKALDKEIARIQEINLFNIELRVTGNSLFLESQKELIIFRIVQEALNNIIKHSKASWVVVRLHYYSNEIEISIYDNGKGFCKQTYEQGEEKKVKAGLNNMNKRAAIFNGKTLIESVPGRGTFIFVTIPY